MRRELCMGFVLLFLGLPACDSFMTVEGRVTDCSTGAPLVGARARLDLRDGISDSEENTAYSAPDGTFDVALNEPPDVGSVLTLDKPRFKPLTREFSQAPEGRQNFCLEPLP